MIAGVGEDDDVTSTQPAAPPTVNHAAIRASRTPMDMIKAIAVLIVPVGILFGLYVWFFGGNNAIAIDPSSSYSDARAAAQFTVEQPQSLPKGWTAVSSDYEPGPPAVLRVGYIAPDGDGIQLMETNQASGKVLPAELGTFPADSPAVNIGDATWGFVDGSRNSGLVVVDGNRTILVMGKASESDLIAFARTLR